MLLLSLAFAESPWWAAVPWEEPLPSGLEAEHDWPWGAREGWDCGWRGEVLLCAQDGLVREAWRRSEEPVTEGRARVLRTAGYEWSYGLWTTETAGRLDLRRWGTPAEPHRGWEGAYAPPLSEEVRSVGIQIGGRRAGTVLLEGSELLGSQGLEACRGPLFAQPFELLFDDSGQARLFRVQGMPELEADWDCVATVLLRTKLDEVNRVPSIEARLTLLSASK
jgi:hypothetical protein